MKEWRVRLDDSSRDPDNFIDRQRYKFAYSDLLIRRFCRSSFIQRSFSTWKINWVASEIRCDMQISIAGTANPEYSGMPSDRASRRFRWVDHSNPNIFGHRTGEPYRLSIELPAIAKCRRPAFEHSTMVQERLSCTIDTQPYRTSITCIF